VRLPQIQFYNGSLGGRIPTPNRVRLPLSPTLIQPQSVHGDMPSTGLKASPPRALKRPSGNHAYNDQILTVKDHNLRDSTNSFFEHRPLHREVCLLCVVSVRQQIIAAPSETNRIDTAEGAKAGERGLVFGAGRILENSAESNTTTFSGPYSKPLTISSELSGP
jgi:hypothetical protein